jgi:hypothetical protein
MMLNLLTILASKVTLFSADNIGNACIPHGLDFFGLKAWYYYLPQSDFDGCNIKNFHFLAGGGQADLPLILLAILDDLLIIAGIVAIGYVMIGAFKYVSSQGDPEQTGRAQATIINALVGTAIAIVAAAFVNFLGQKLGGA